MLFSSYNVNYHLLWDKNKIYIALDKWNKYLRDLEFPRILHFTSAFKPWKNPDLPNASIWWQYARKSPFYEEILFRNIKNTPSATKELLSGVYNYRKNMFKYYRYKVLSKITFGKTRKKYKQKRKDLTEVLANHHLPYVAQTAAIGNFKDITEKAEKCTCTMSKRMGIQYRRFNGNKQTCSRNLLLAII